MAAPITPGKESGREMRRKRRTALFFFQAEDCIRDRDVTGVQTCALPIWLLLVVLIDHLDRPACHLAAEMIERQFERIARVVADRGGRTAEGRDKADSDGIRRDGGPQKREGHRSE